MNHLQKPVWEDGTGVGTNSVVLHGGASMVRFTQIGIWGEFLRSGQTMFEWVHRGLRTSRTQGFPLEHHSWSVSGFNVTFCASLYELVLFIVQIIKTIGCWAGAAKCLVLCTSKSLHFFILLNISPLLCSKLVCHVLLLSLEGALV